MNPRTTGILFLVVAALGAFVYFYEIRGGAAREVAEKEAKRLFPGIEADEVASIHLLASSGEEVRVERREGGWRLVEPLDFPADPGVLDGLARTLAQLVSETALEDPQPLDVYGLDETGRSTVGFRTPGGDHDLYVGKNSPVGSNTYVTTATDDRVFTVASRETGNLEKSLDDIRDKRLLRFERSDVDHIEASWPGGGVTLRRGEEGWQLEQPLAGPADADAVRGLLSDVSFLNAAGFLADPPPDGELGLDEPEFELRLHETVSEGGEAVVHHLRIGSRLGDDELAARAAEDVVYRIPAVRLDDFPRNVSAYRFRDLASFAASDAQSFELVFHDGETGTTVGVTGQRDESDAWQTSPDAMGPGLAARLVTELSRLEADEIRAESMGADELRTLGLLPPLVIARVKGEAESEGDEPAQLAEVHLGVSDAERGIFARTPGNDQVFTLNYDLAEHIPVSLEAFRNRFIAQEEDTEEAGEGGEAGQDETSVNAPDDGPEEGQ